ncbi:MAG: endoglucanase [Actinomycetota bacterium]|jgi:hypothetical protein
MRRLLVCVLFLAAGLVFAAPARGAATIVRVSGNHFVDGAGTTIALHGVNRSGTEYACQQGWGFFDGPVDNAAIAAMVAWKINVVRVPLNEDCWLGINGVKPEYGGTAYRNTIKAFVQRLHDHGLFVILDLHVAAPGTTLSTDIIKMADADHAPAFWRSVANAYKADLGVIFDLYNEPHDITWDCWRNGCTVDGYRAAGMAQLLSAVRGTGAKNVVILGGNRWSGDPSQWKSRVPSDSQHQLGLSMHSYNFNGCNTTTCKNQVKAIAATFPVVAGEIGEDDCAHNYVDALLNWLDTLKASYLGWTWDAGGGWTCTGGPTLIKDYSGAPTNFGIGLKNHLAAL